MKTEMNDSQNINTESHKDIISKILSEMESNDQALEKIYKILNEASEADDLTMDTDLIDECIKTIEMLEGKQECVSQEKMQEMKQSIKLRYLDSEDKEYKHSNKKKFFRIAACLILFFSTTVAVANAFGFNPVKMIVSWKEEAFNLSSQNENNVVQNDENTSFFKLEDAVLNIKPAPMVPTWVPDGFTFKYAEKYVRSDNINLLLYYEGNDNKYIIFDLTIYNNTSRNTEGETSFEKDSTEVEIYEKEGINHYIFSNIEQIQALWTKLNVIYNVSGDISSEEMKKIIDSMISRNHE
ncbi:DUF4367 domain-containing protein [Sedimentibacter sp.]|uniref:DUF4367 domain-containing protein n=1 Tax=Sedimentibacter sp. TaxID=1960295 RepID=UPI0028AB5456|nr:DUF4367 domain-containing protein [Sedimentibacter sp.]